MKKILYYLSNIILGVYLILFPYVFKIRLQVHQKKDFVEYMSFNKDTFKIALGIVLIASLLKLIFLSKKFELKEAEKKIGTIIFAIEIFLTFLTATIFSFA